MRGGKCKAYVNSGVFATPTWLELKKFRTVNRPQAKPKGETTGRGDKHKTFVTGQPEITVSAECVYKPGDTAYQKLDDAFEGEDIVVDMIFVDAPGGPGAVGKRGDFLVTKFDRKEEIDGAVMIDIELVLTDLGGHEWSDFTYPS